MGQVVHRKGEFNALCTPAGGAVAGVLQPGIEHQCIEWHLVMAELFDRLGHRRKVRQIGNADVNGTRQSRADSLGPFCIAANNGECITTGQQDFCRFKANAAAGTGDQNAALFSSRHGV